MARSRSFVSSKPARAFLSLAVLAIVAVGCDSGTEEPDAPTPEAVEYTAPAPAETPGSTDGGDPTAATDALVAEGFKAEIPDNFPTNVPVPESARPLMGQGGEVDGAQRSGVQLAIDQSPSEVLSFYQDELTAGGWTLADAPDNALTATNGGDTVMLFVVPDPAGGSTVYMITEEGAVAQ